MAKFKRGVGFFFNWQTKILSFLAAILVFFLFSYSFQQKRIITVQLDTKLPENYNATSIIPETVDLVIVGNESVIYTINVDKIKLTADFSNVSEEGVASAFINIDCSSLPENIDISDLTITTKPTYIRVYFEK